MKNKKITMYQGIAIPTSELKTLLYLSIPSNFTGRMEITFKDGVIESELPFKDDEFRCSIAGFIEAARLYGWSVTPISQ